MQPSSAGGQATFQQIDAVAALQQLQTQRSAAMVQAKSPKKVSNTKNSFFAQPSHRSRTPQHSVPQLKPRQHTAKSKARPQQYSNDGMRLSDFGEEPLAINTPHSPRQNVTTTSHQPDAKTEDCASTSGRSMADDYLDQEFLALSDSRRTGYICSTKDDPLVKGRYLNVASLLTAHTVKHKQTLETQHVWSVTCKSAYLASRQACSCLMLQRLFQTTPWHTLLTFTT